MNFTVKSIVVITITLMLQIIAFSQQDNERTLISTKWRTSPPLKIKTVKTKDDNYQLGEKFSAEDDWWRELSISL